jgi:hypothetical protein
VWNIFNSPKLAKGQTTSPLAEYRLGRRFDPGAEAEVFLPTLNNPVYLFRGNARLAGWLKSLQAPQVLVQPSIGIGGLGGIQAGFIISQGLVDPSQLDTES